MPEYIGKGVVSKHVEQAKKEILENKEELVGIFDGMIERSNGGRGFTLHDYLIVTNKRLIMWGRGLISKNVETFDYSKVINVQAHQGLILGQIELNVFGAKELFKNMQKSDVPIAAEMIKKRMDGAKETKIGKDTETEDPLKILKMRYAKGDITKEEYTQMKKELGL